MKKEYYYDKYLDQHIEVPRHYYHHCLSNDELLKVFPEAKWIVPVKIKEWEEDKKEVLNNKIKPLLKEIRKIDDEFAGWYYRMVLKKIVMKDLLGDINKQLRRLRKLERLLEIKETSRGGDGKFYEEEIKKVKEIPIFDVVSSQLNLIKSGKNYKALCPFHREEHPSFYIYPKTGSFYCYGCSRGGDIVEFVKLYFGYNFKEAIRYLKDLSTFKPLYNK